uniref:Uncharacterized protein n=1 Tax=Peromyscus maniculatus bairdii TaxID=230844 RepID=A0A8C8W7Y4_PERMB
PIRGTGQVDTTKNEIEWKHLKIVSGGRRHSGKSGNPSLEDQPKKGSDFEREEKDLGTLEEGVDEEKTPVIDKHGKKRPSARIIGDTGGKKSKHRSLTMTILSSS